jgi:hypothetical protein
MRESFEAAKLEDCTFKPLHLRRKSAVLSTGAKNGTTF